MRSGHQDLKLLRSTKGNHVQEKTRPPPRKAVVGLFFTNQNKELIMSEHTPGPWKIGDEYDYGRDEIEGAHGGCLAVVWTRRPKSEYSQATRPCYKDDAVGKANANLIAAAPDYDTFAREFLAYMICADRDDVDFGRGEKMDKLIQMAIAAIAKADGKKN
jgi:hypothetical protein